MSAPVSANARRRAPSPGAIVSQGWRHAILLAAVIVTLFPFVWMVLAATRPADELFTATFHLWPRKWVPLENFRAAFNEAPLLRFMVNGVLVCGGILCVQLAVAIPAAYALAKFEFRGKALLFAIVVFGLCVPIQVIALPLYLGLNAINKLDTYLALMLPFFLSVFAIFLFRQFFKSFPDDIVNAGRLDGYSEMAILWKIVVPNAKAAVSAFAVFSITAHWNDLYWPLIVVTSTAMAPPSLGILYFSDDNANQNFGALMAAATVITLPLLVAFLAAQRQFIQGMTMSAIK